MAEGKITITILDGGDGSDEKKEKQEKTPAQKMLDKVNKIAHPLKTLGDKAENNVKQMLGGGAGATAMVAGAIKLGSEVLSLATYYAKLEFNRYFTLKEDYVGQNKISEIQAYSGTVKSMLSSIGSDAIAGAMVGSYFGLAGVVVGGVLGGAFGGGISAIKAKTETAQKIEQVNMQMNATNMQTQFSATRAGLVNGSRGTEY